ncbi:MAG TPA: Fic family protein [Actinomycetota bacterium]|nr:Fic family protein [Actinomycetota bacterium]
MRGNYERRTWQAAPEQYGPPRYRKACEYETFLAEPLSSLDLALTGDAAAVLSEAERAIGALNATAKPELQPLARLLLRTESIASSKVEGLQVDARALARAEASQDLGQRIGPQATDVLANVEAMLYAIETAAGSSSVAIDDLLAIHRVLLNASANADIAGRIRRSQNWIGGNDYNPCGADFVPPPPELVEGLLSDLCAFCNDSSLPPLVQAAIAHAQFETIHPFEDGNGRTGRALIQVILKRRGLAPAFVPPISVVLAENKARYIRGLTLYRNDRIGEWLETFASAAARAATLATAYVEAVAALQEQWRRRVERDASPRGDAAVWTIIEHLPAHPVFTIAVGVAVTGRSRPAVRNGIEELVEAGVLTPVSVSPKNKSWEVGALLDLIEGLESAREIGTRVG